MKAEVRWLGEVSFIGQSERGQSVVMDGAPEHGGRNLGFRPMELVLVGLGGCSAFDVVEILKKARQPVTDCLVEISAERADVVPAVFTNIHLGYKVVGSDLKDNLVARAVSLSVEKYCSASMMLRNGGVKVSHDYKIVSSL